MLNGLPQGVSVRKGLQIKPAFVLGLSLRSTIILISVPTQAPTQIQTRIPIPIQIQTQTHIHPK